ncbi:hypothetical protein K7432_012517 [Basidiobolus ranarum]|uniref:MABP domain-containing protein n=1 Tax=Basidiobolus ranarum TaxID=34480 RepID=A0ABR2WKR9_9FUNG
MKKITILIVLCHIAALAVGKFVYTKFIQSDSHSVKPIQDADDGFITDIILSACDSTRCELPEPWYCIPLGLNIGARGKHIYLHYRKERGPQPLTNVILLKDTDKVTGGYRKLDVNVNEGTVAPKRCLVYTNDRMAGAPIQNLLVNWSYSTCLGWISYIQLQ